MNIQRKLFTMNKNIVICPACSHELSISDALGAELKSFYENEANNKIKDAVKKIRAEVEGSNVNKIQELSNMLADYKIREDSLSEKEVILKEKEQQLEEIKFSAELEIKKRIEAERCKIEEQSSLIFEQERKKIHEKIRSEIEQNTNLEINELTSRVTMLMEREREFKELELSLRRKNQEIEEKQATVELEIQRKLDSERGRIACETAERINEEHRLRSLEKDKQLSDMKRQIEELQKKSEQGSQKLQGDVLEIEVERILRENFPFDKIEAISNGVRGGDIIQTVITKSGKVVGKIIWEMKNTKSFSDAWICKLKDDQRCASADFAVLVTQALPKGVPSLSCHEGVWVTDFSTYIGIANALRMMIIGVDQARILSSNMDEKVGALYTYLTGVQFKQRIEAIVETFVSMHSSLQKEKAAITRNWAAREQQINRILIGTTGMYGDIQGIVGADLPRIQALELDSFVSSAAI